MNPGANMTKEGLKHRFSETIIKLGRGMSCVQSQAVSDWDKDDEPPFLKRRVIANLKEVGPVEEDSGCIGENEEREILDTFQPQRIRRSISFTGFGVHEVQRLRRIAEDRSSNENPCSVVNETRRNRCHSFAGVKNKKLVEVTRGLQDTAVVDGLLTTTFCSTEL